MKISTKQSSLFLSFKEAFQKIIKMFNYHSEKFRKVKYNLLIFIEKKTIVFDIDETLVHSTTNRNELTTIDEVISIKTTRFGGQCRAFLSFRPFLYEMLDELSKYFELILYTCGTESYAACFAEAVQKHRKYFNHVLSLQHCLFSMENEIFIKDLKILEEGRSMSDIIIVDNNI